MEIKIIASGSKGNCYQIKYKDTTLLLEAGIPFKEIQKALNFKLSEVDACLVSHEHLDHAKAVKDLMKHGVDCYMTQGTADVLGVSGHRLKTFRTLNGDADFYYSVVIKNLVVVPFRTKHDAKEPVSFVVTDRYRVKNLAFITDTAYTEYKLPPNLTHLMVECNYIKEIIDKRVESGAMPVSLRNRVVQNHMSLETLLEMLRANDLSRLEEVYLLHLSDGNSDEKRIKEAVQRATGVKVVVC